MLRTALPKITKHKEYRSMDIIYFLTKNMGRPRLSAKSIKACKRNS